MLATELRPNSLVLYKNRPARVTHAGPKKIEIEVEGGPTISVRPKDVTLLHPGPVGNLAQLRPPAGEVKTAWELLAGTTTKLAELAELAYGAYTPATAWAAWQLVNDGLYFRGSPEEIVARSSAAVAAEQAARAAKVAEERAWIAFLERTEAGRFQPEDEPYLQDVVALALGQSTQSRVLRTLGRGETPQNAHALLLALGYWDETVNPYPQRVGAPIRPPAVPLPHLPGEPRRDLTHLTALAIDDEGNRDPDDALSWEDGRLWVHVADVAALVVPDSPADLEARDRGASLYLPEGTVPMLPPKAAPALGLGLAEVSPALSLGLHLNPAAEVVGLEVVPSWVRVTRLTYEEAEAQLEEPLLRPLAELAQTYLARRQANGAIEIELPEVKIRVEDGRVVIRPLPALRSRVLVREAMLMAGEAVARFALEHNIAVPFSTQDAPETEIELATTTADMFAVRRTLRRSQQTTAPGSHAGLGMKLYVQSTSPLRRYLDLVVHQQLRAHLRGEPLLDTAAMTARIGATGAVSGSVRQAERLSLEHWTLVYLMQHPEWRGEGIVVDKRGARDLILIPELGLETQMYLSRDVPLGGGVSLALKAVNLPELEAHFRLV